MPEIVFIDGTQRSGTGLVQRLLDGHSQLGVYPFEDRTILGLWEGYDDIDNALRTRRPQQLTAALLRWGGLSTLKQHSEDGYIEFSRNPESYSSRNEFDFEVAGFVHEFEASLSRRFEEEGEELPTVSDMYQEYLASFYRTLERDRPDAAPRRYFVVKQPESTPALRFFFEHFSSGRVIYVIRDPKGWLTSLRWFPSYLENRDIRPLHSACEQWVRETQPVLGLQREVGSERLAIVSYEELVEHTSDVMTGLCDWLGIPVEECLRTPTFMGNSWVGDSTYKGHEGVYADSTARWRQLLTSCEISYIETLCQRTMAAFGVPRHSEKRLWRGLAVSLHAAALRFQWSRIIPLRMLSLLVLRSLSKRVTGLDYQRD